MRWLLVVMLLCGTAAARSEKVLAYQRADAWPTAVRFLRVDARLKVIEKDADAGYVLFELRDDKKTYRGSLEVIDVVKDGRKQVRFVMAIEDRPAYLEVQLLDKLEQKLRAELGAPAPEPTKKPKESAPKEPPKEEPKPDDGPKVSPTP